MSKTSINQKNLDKLISESIDQRIRADKTATWEKRKSFVIEIVKVVLTPIAIAAIGIWGTNQLTSKELSTTTMLADQQMKNAELISDRQIEGANMRSEAERDITRLEQIREIYETILQETKALHSNSKSDDLLDPIMLQISSLEIYQDLALNFLVNLRNHYKSKSEHPYDVLYEHTKASIDRILKLSQPDFTYLTFAGEDDKKLNMRYRQLFNYNLSHSTFKNVNLFRAQFTQSTLENVVFDDVDLYGVDFSDANLTGSNFLNNTNLRKTNFMNAKLTDVEFKNCVNLEDAQFSFRAVLKVDHNPFKNVDKNTYLKLLPNYRDKFEQLYDQDTETVNKIAGKVGMSSDELMQYLRENDKLMNAAENQASKNRLALQTGRSNH